MSTGGSGRYTYDVRSFFLPLMQCRLAAASAVQIPSDSGGTVIEKERINPVLSPDREIGAPMSFHVVRSENR
jgi:hypothetical protein